MQAALELARRHHLEALTAGPALTSPRLAGDYLLAELRDRDYEVFCCLHLDNRHRLIAFDELFRGTIDGASVHPREVVKAALARNAGLGSAEFHLTLAGSAKRRVYCPHCKSMTSGVSRSVVSCSGCGAALFVRDHFSRLHAAYTGVRVDAEVPGVIPPAEELYP